MIGGVEILPLKRHEDARGWFCELAATARSRSRSARRTSSWSRKGVVRGAALPRAGQDDLFLCLQGMVRVVVLDRETGETFSEDIGDDNPVGDLRPGPSAHGYEALTDALFCYLVTEEYDPRRRVRSPLGRSARRDLWGTRIADPLRTGQGRGVLITGAGGQLGAALQEEFPRATRAARARTGTSASRATRASPDLVLHAAAWTDVDGAEDDPQAAAAVNVRGTRMRRPRRTSRLLLDRLRLRRQQAVAVFGVRRPNPISVYGARSSHGEPRR